MKINQAEVKFVCGRPRIYLNGGEVSPVLYGLSDIPASRCTTKQARRNIRNFGEAGIDLIQIDLNLREAWQPDGATDISEAVRELSAGWAKSAVDSKYYYYDPRKLNTIPDGTVIMIEVPYTEFSAKTKLAYYTQTSNAVTNTYQNQATTSSNFSYKIDFSKHNQSANFIFKDGHVGTYRSTNVYWRRWKPE